MPFSFDFGLANGELHTVEVSPKGWRGPITIEYIVAQAHQYDTMASVVWRIKGTEGKYGQYIIYECDKCGKTFEATSRLK